MNKRVPSDASPQRTVPVPGTSGRRVLLIRRRDLALIPVVDVVAFAVFIAAFFGDAEPS